MYKDEASLLDIDTAARYILETSAGLTKAELLENEDVEVSEDIIVFHAVCEVSKVHI